MKLLSFIAFLIILNDLSIGGDIPQLITRTNPGSVTFRLLCAKIGAVGKVDCIRRAKNMLQNSHPRPQTSIGRRYFATSEKMPATTIEVVSKPEATTKVVVININGGMTADAKFDYAEVYTITGLSSAFVTIFSFFIFLAKCFLRNKRSYNLSAHLANDELTLVAVQ